MKKPLFIYMQHIAPQHLLSRFAGVVMNCRWPWLKNFLIKGFIKQYGVNMSEAEKENPKSYECFNDFFTRHLKTGARTIDKSSDSIVSPADGSISQIGHIHDDQIIQAKGINYSLKSLVGGDEKDAMLFKDGEFATIYLSPKDYHRVHMPLSGRLKKMIYVPGDLFSVNDLTAQHVQGLFARNERAVCFFETDLGEVAVILVGAMLVASIHTVWAGKVTPNKNKALQLYDYEGQNITLKKGEELGFFSLGSTAIMLFPKNTIEWKEDQNLGGKVCMGQVMGAVKQKS